MITRQGLVAAVKPLVELSGLPSVDELRVHWTAGRRQLINISGVSMYELYPAQDWKNWLITESLMPDIFSADERPLNGAQITPQDFLALVDNNSRQAFLDCALALQDALCGFRSSLVFCQQGVGRSPAVAASAMAGALNISESTACELVLSLRPQARVSRATLGAVSWFRQVAASRRP